MQDDAARLGKKILLILQNTSQLVSGGITLKSTPAMLTLKGQCNEARFEYMGKVLRYPESVA